MIAIDWGTSSFRAYRLDPKGAILETRVSADGILSVKDFPQTLERQIAGWSERPVVMSGMVGSRQGWQEAPYVECPAGAEEISRGMQEVKSGVWIVPGVACREGVADVMRGEETQIIGCGVTDGVICLPGTHSKWVEVRGGRIMRFTTHMTGEVFAVMKEHSILGRMMAAKQGRSSFLEGVGRSGDPGGLLHHLFGVRTRALMNEAVDPGTYLSGILVGHELRAAGANQFWLLGTRAVASLYEQAAAALGIECRTLDESAAARGLYEVAATVRGD